jgi:hypothetical protein
LRDLQTSKIIIHSEKLVLDPKFFARFSQGSRVKISNDSRESRYKISVCKTCESRYEICLQDSRVSLQNCLRDLREVSLATKLLSARLARSESCYEISFCKTCEKRVLLRNFFLQDSQEAILGKKRYKI